MARQLTYALVADGGTDRVLQPIVERSIRCIDPTVEILEPEFRKRRGPVGLIDVDHLHGAMLIFVHRDAEGADPDVRRAEFADVGDERVVPVIPVRMTEAWLLGDARAIARAAGRPKATIVLPAPRQIEQLADPKSVLERLLIEAAGDPTGRKRKQFTRRLTTHRVNAADYITDFTVLDSLSAYQRFMQDLKCSYPFGAPPST